MRRLGDLEAVVMDRLWDWNEPTSVRRVVDDLQADRPLAYTTIMTVLENLHRKGFVTREKQGRAYVYSAAQTREQHTASLMSEVLAGSQDTQTALLHFVGDLSPAELARLKKVIDEFTPRRKRG